MKTPAASVPAAASPADAEGDGARPGLKMKRTSFPPWSSAAAKLNVSNQRPKNFSHSPIPLPPVPATNGSGRANVVVSKPDVPSSETSRTVSNIARPEQAAAAATEAPPPRSPPNSMPETKQFAQARNPEPQRTRENKHLVKNETSASTLSLPDTYASGQDAETAEAIGSPGLHTMKFTLPGFKIRKRSAGPGPVGAVRGAKRHRSGHPPLPEDDSAMTEDDLLQAVGTSHETSLEAPLSHSGSLNTANAPASHESDIFTVDSNPGSERITPSLLSHSGLLNNASAPANPESGVFTLGSSPGSEWTTPARSVSITEEDELTMEMDGAGDRLESEDGGLAQRNFRLHSFPMPNVQPLPSRPPNRSSCGAKPSLTTGELVALQTATDGRGYNLYKAPSGKIESGCGAIIPAHYKLYDDSRLPFICPIRTCRKLFRSVLALGAHFSAGHRHKCLNDNLDGTFSIIGERRGGVGKKSTSIVVSQNPLDPVEAQEPMAEPKQPYYVRDGLKYDDIGSAPLVPQPPKPVSTPRPKAPYVAPRRRSDYTKDKDQPNRGRSTTEAEDRFRIWETRKKSALALYVLQYLSQGYAIPNREDVFELLGQPRQRHLPASWISWIKKHRDSSLEPPCFAAILLYLTGDPPKSHACRDCARSCEPFDRCVAVAEAAPQELKEILRDTCASCMFTYAWQKQKNGCSLLRAPLFPVRSAQAAGSGVDEDEEIENVVGATETGAEIYEEPVGSLPPRQWGRRRKDENQAAGPGILMPGWQVMPASTLEMEDWEVAPGRIRDESGATPENVAFSNSYLTVNQSVPVSNNVGFHVIVIRPGGSHQFDREPWTLRICSLAAGKLRVKVGELRFTMGPNGMFKITPGVVGSVENRLYIDAVLHISAIGC